MYWKCKIERINSYAYFIHVEEENITINDKKFLLSDLKARTDFREFNRFAFPTRGTMTPTLVQDVLGGNHEKPVVFDPFEVFAQTSQSKIKILELARMMNVCLDISIVFYPETRNFKDALLIVNAPADENTPLVVTTTASDGGTIEYIPDRIITELPFDLMPQCEVKKIGFDGTNTDLEFTYKNLYGTPVSVDFTAKVKTSSGFVSHTDLPVIGGKARFKWNPQGVPPGYKSTIQVGIGKHSEVASITLDT